VEILFYIGATLIVLATAVKLIHVRNRHRAASNLVFAKHTFNQLAVAQQNTVHDKAIEIVLASNTKMRGFANEVERFGWYALAMNALGIQSTVPDNPSWYKIKNPYSAIIPGDAMIYNVTGALQQQYDITVKISAKKGYPEKSAATAKAKKKANKK